jgi:hypothetical protein
MDGANNRKIGGDVFTGRLRGAKILSLALEERATCPSSCLHWRSCYGNNMHRQIRWAHGSNLQAAITRQVDDYFARDPEALLLVRLHVLGDFYSMDYLETWVTLLDKHAGLTVFGFTAYDKGTKIGNAIDRARDALPDQFMIRNSGRHGEMGSMTIDYPTRKSVLQSAGIKSYVCPEQLDANEGSPKETHCGSCALCWESRVNITFIEH